MTVDDNRRCDRCGLVGSIAVVELMAVSLGKFHLAAVCPRCVPAVIEAIAGIVPTDNQSVDLKHWARLNRLQRPDG